MKFAIAWLGIAAAITVFAQSDALETVLGGDKGTIETPNVVVSDAAGNVYVGLSDRRCVLRIDVKDGTVTRFAGGGKATWGDGGPATEARLRGPSGLAFDTKGNLYIADPDSARVRMVSNGTITTVAGNGVQDYGGDGGPATSASLNAPSGVAVDAAGNLYIADWGNHRIRKVSGGIITTIAGTGSAGDGGDNGPALRAQFNSPSDVAVDAHGNLYIADANVPRIRVIANGAIRTIAGTEYGFGGDGGPAAKAKLSNPIGLAFDTAGGLYIADAGNHRIRKIAAGTITTVAGDGNTATLNWPRSVAITPAGKMYIADSRNERIRRKQ